MIRKLSALFLALLLTLTAVPALARTEPQDFFGTWEVVYFVADGVVTTPDSIRPASDLTGLVLTASTYTARLANGSTNACTVTYRGDILTNQWGGQFQLIAPDLLMSYDNNNQTTILRRVNTASSSLLGRWQLLSAYIGGVAMTAREYPGCTASFIGNQVTFTSPDGSGSLPVRYQGDAAVITLPDGNTLTVRTDEQRVLILSAPATGDVLLFAPVDP